MNPAKTTIAHDQNMIPGLRGSGNGGNQTTQIGENPRPIA
jgi:hypothetical protein